MNSSAKSTVYHAQHKNKCYCNNGNFCCCFANKNFNKNSTTPRKFIKIRRDTDKSKPTSSVGVNSLSMASSPAPTLMTSVSASSLSRGFSSEPRLTESREFYERSKAGSTQFFDIREWNTLEHREPKEPENICDEKIAKLQEFRLQHADECLSSCSRYSIEKGLQMDCPNNDDNIANVKYTLNKRGLLKPYGGKDDQPAVVVPSQNAAKDILRQAFNSTKEKEKFLRKALCMPENSLALRYQKTY